MRLSPRSSRSWRRSRPSPSWRGRSGRQTLLVFAAASLTDELDRVTEAWEQETGNRAVMSYAGPSALTRQI